MTVLAAHADWSVDPRKRFMAVAAPDGRVTLDPVGALPTLLDRLRDQADGGPVALGVDAPIGLPLAYRRAFDSFPAFLRSLEPDAPFFSVCDDVADISPERPFYPNRVKAGQRRSDLLDRLGLASAAELLRQCERRVGAARAAAPLFWTVGASQAGKGALCLWRDLLGPALRGAAPPALWPFDGALADLLQPGRVAVAEMYPADAMVRLGVALPGSKRSSVARKAVSPRLLAVLHALAATPDPALAAQIEDGFGDRADGEDRFDSLLGLLRLLQVIQDPSLDERPAPPMLGWEGWILGRPVTNP